MSGKRRKVVRKVKKRVKRRVVKRGSWFVLIFLIGLLVLTYLITSKRFESVSSVNVINGTSSVNGVNLTVIQCGGCFDASQIIDELISAGINISRITYLNESSSDGFETLPIIIMSENIRDYPFFNSLKYYGYWRSGEFVMNKMEPPVKNLSSGELLTGEVELIFVQPFNCTNCYDVRVHKLILNRFGLRIISERTVYEDDSLVEKYNITKIPTIILSPQAQLYSTFMRVWSSVGTVEDDGFLVFRDVETISSGAFKELSN